MKFIVLVLICASIVFLMVIQYLLAQMFNLLLPNEFLPWAETSSKPYALGCIYKTILAFSYSFREQLTIKLILLSCTIFILAYKIYLRLKKSIVFNNTILKCYLIIDVVLIHFLFFLEIAHLLDEIDTVFISLFVLPSTVCITLFYLIPAFKQN